MELKNISKSYQGKAVLSDLCVQLPEQGVCAVLGPSGCGKTTLLRLILGLEKPDSGSIPGVPAKKAAVFQEDRLFPQLTLKANLLLTIPGADLRQFERLCTALGLSGSLAKPISAYSGGMSRRAALVRALCADAPLLVLDEPFSGLDEDNRAACGAAIASAAEGRLLIYTAHDAPEPLLPAPDVIIDLT